MTEKEVLHIELLKLEIAALRAAIQELTKILTAAK